MMKKTNRTTRRQRHDNRVVIVPVSNLRYSVEGYIERRHPEFAYDTSLHGLMSDLISSALLDDIGVEYSLLEKWVHQMAIYDDTTHVESTETVMEVIRRIDIHLGHYQNLFAENPSWEWLNSRQLDVVIFGRPR